MYKRCSKCGRGRRLKFFGRDPRYRLGVKGWCKDCELAYSRLPRQRRKSKERWAEYMSDPKNRAYERKRSKAKYDPEKSKDYALRQMGITLKRFRRSSRCALCRKRPNRLCADHNHRTGKFRGVLCVTCNTTLSKFENQPGFLKRLIQYLRRGL